jgi:hypothetical protein
MVWLTCFRQVQGKPGETNFDEWLRPGPANQLTTKHLPFSHTFLQESEQQEMPPKKKDEVGHRQCPLLTIA